MRLLCRNIVGVCPSGQTKYCYCQYNPKNLVPIHVFLQTRTNPHVTDETEFPSTAHATRLPNFLFPGTRGLRHGPRQAAQLFAYSWQWLGCDYHPSVQQIAFVDTETGEFGERRLERERSRKVLPRPAANRSQRARGDGSNGTCTPSPSFRIELRERRTHASSRSRGHQGRFRAENQRF